MKIIDANVFVVKNKFPQKGGDYWYFIKLITDSGIEGWGEMCWNRMGSEAYIASINDVIEKIFLNQSPFNIEVFFQKFFQYYMWQHADLTKFGIFSGIEIACWDIIGKSLNKPVYDLLGGLVNRKLRSYTYIYTEDPTADHKKLWANPDECAERALFYVNQGFTAVKLDPVDLDIEGIAPPWHVTMPVLDRAEKTIARIREAIGYRADIIIGTHGQYTAASAIRFIKRMEKYDPLWFEEPIPPENPAQMARVNQSTTVPVAAGERLCTKYEFADLISLHAADILQLDIAGIGGILESKKIAAMAEAFHLQVTPHFWAGPILYAAQAQISSCIPNFIIQEVIERMDGFHSEFIKTPFTWDNGYMVVSDEPGIGVEVNEKEVRKYSVNL